MKILFLIVLIIYQGIHAFGESQQTQPHPVGQTVEVQQTPQRPASTFLGQMIANLINYKLRWLSMLADRMAGNSTGWPIAYFTPTTNMVTPTALHFTPTTNQGIPTTQQTSPTTASDNTHPQVPPVHSAPSNSPPSASPITHTDPTDPPNPAAHSPTIHDSPTTSHSTQPVHSPQTTTGTRAPAQTHASPSKPHSVQSADEPPSAVPLSLPIPQEPQAAHSPSTHPAQVSPTSSVSSSDTTPPSIPILESALTQESPNSPELGSSNTFAAEQTSPPVVSSNPLSFSLSEPGFPSEAEVPTTSQVAPAPVSVPDAFKEGTPKPPPLSTPLSALQPPPQSALDGY